MVIDSTLIEIRKRSKREKTLDLDGSERLVEVLVLEDAVAGREVAIEAEEADADLETDEDDVLGFLTDGGVEETLAEDGRVGEDGDGESFQPEAATLLRDPRTALMTDLEIAACFEFNSRLIEEDSPEVEVEGEGEERREMESCCLGSETDIRSSSKKTAFESILFKPS